RLERRCGGFLEFEAQFRILQRQGSRETPEKWRLRYSREIAALTAERLHLRQHARGLGLKRIALNDVIRLRILAGLVLEVQVAEVLIDNLLALAQIVQPRLLRRRSQPVLRPEDIRAAGKQQKNGRKHNREVHRQCS